MAALIYLASPYSHPSEAVRHFRYLNARRVTIKLLEQDVAVFSPIVYGKDMETAIGTVFEAWQVLNDTMIAKCDEVVVLCDDGWKKSRGIGHEIKLATQLGKPVRFMDVEGNFL
jgi:hypothetical protein